MSDTPTKIQSLNLTTEQKLVKLQKLEKAWKIHKLQSTNLIKNLEAKLNYSKDCNKKTAQKLDILQNENANLKSVLNKSKTLNNTYQNKIIANSEDKTSLYREIEQLKKEIFVLKKDRKDLSRDNDKLRSAFKKMENSSRLIQSDLKETKSELEVFERMLSAIPRGSASCSRVDDFLAFETSLNQTQPDFSFNFGSDGQDDCSTVVSTEISSVPKMVYPECSTPIDSDHGLNRLLPKYSLATELDKLARKHKETERSCRELVKLAREMKAKDANRVL